MSTPRSPLNAVRLVHYTDERIADPLADHQELSWQAYHTARNAIVRACRRHGPTGPMGECQITDGDDPPDDWPVGDDDPAFFVVDDQLNHERYIYLEALDRRLIGPPLVADLLAALADLPGWGLGVTNVRDSYLLLFATHVLVHGRAFEDANSLREVIRVWRQRADVA